MKQIRPRRTKLRINNPASFGILCAMILVLAVGGVYALAAGVIAPAINAQKAANATPTPSPTVAPVTNSADPAASPDATPEESPVLTPEPTQTPEPKGKLDGRVIGLDPARSYSSKYQAVSTKTYANRTNLAVAKLVKERLEAEGATVVMSYTEVKTTIDDAGRAKALNAGNPDIVLRIEVNYVSAADTRGAQMWAPQTHDKKTACTALASAVLKAYIAETGFPIRQYEGASIRYMTGQEIFTKIKVPIATIIMGHISNATDDKFLNSDDTRAKAAKGIADGILAYFNAN